MILAIDCGNTNTVFALYTTNKEIKQLTSWRINNDSQRTADLYYPWLLKMFEISKFEIKSVTGVSIASVVPETLVNIKLLKSYKSQIRKFCDKIEYLEIRNNKNTKDKEIYCLSNSLTASLQIKVPLR